MHKHPIRCYECMVPCYMYFWPLRCKTLHLYIKALKMLYIFPICSYNDSCWCFVNLCLCKAHFGETRCGSFQFLLFVSHLVDCPIFTGFVWHHTRDIFHPVFFNLNSLLSIYWMDIHICKIIIIFITTTIVLLLCYLEIQNENTYCVRYMLLHVLQHDRIVIYCKNMHS